MVSCVKPECISAPGDLEPNPDIEGIGVCFICSICCRQTLTENLQFLIAFGLSAFLTLFICFISYLLNQDSLSNEVDRLFIKFVADRGFIKKFANWVSKILKIQGVEKWNKALQMAVLSFSDQQILTGLAILISGYVQLSCRGLAVYHWQIVVDLAFFSSVTHLTTLTCLRTYFQTRNLLRLIRLIFMGVLAAMLGCALWSTGYLLDFSIVEIAFPAWCLYHREIMHKYLTERGDTGSFSNVYVSIVLLYLVLSYLSRLLSLWQGISTALRAGFHHWPDAISWGTWREKARDRAIRRKFNGTRENTNSGNRSIENSGPSQPRGFQILLILLYRAFLSVGYVGQAVKDLYQSVIWEVGWFDYEG